MVKFTTKWSKQYWESTNGLLLVFSFCLSLHLRNVCDWFAITHKKATEFQSSAQLYTTSEASIASKSIVSRYERKRVALCSLDSLLMHSICVSLSSSLCGFSICLRFQRPNLKLFARARTNECEFEQENEGVKSSSWLSRNGERPDTLVKWWKLAIEIYVAGFKHIFLCALTNRKCT